MASTARVLTGDLRLLLGMVRVNRPWRLAVRLLLRVVGPLFAEGLGHPAARSDHLEPAWLTRSLATVGGGPGAGPESDDAGARGGPHPPVGAARP